MSIRRTITMKIGGALAADNGPSTTSVPRAASAVRRRFGRTMLAFALATLSGIGVMASPAAAATSRQQIVSKATSQLGGTACDPGYYNSCGMEWCAEFSRWVWGTAGVSDVRGLDGWAQSFKTYGTARGLYHARSSGYIPQPGDAIVFDWNHDSGDDHPIDHVAIVTSASSTRVNTIGGNQGGTDSYNSSVTRSNYSLADPDIDGYSSPAGVGSAPPAEEPMVGDSVTGDSFTDVLATDPDGKMWLYSNNFVRDAGIPYNGGRREVGHGWNSTTKIMPADVTGDGFTDLLALTSDGNLALYSNNFVRDSGMPYNGGSRQVGHGWGNYTSVIPADVTGDGFTDLLAVDTDGTMWLYSNNFVRDGGVPYNGGRREVGHGWGNYTRVLPADVTGDGFTDLLATDTDGTMWLYSNNFVRDGGVPYNGGRREVGHGWNSTTKIMPADVTGDGFTDLLALTSDGNLALYSNNFVRDGGVPYNGGSRQVGQGWSNYLKILT